MCFTNIYKYVDLNLLRIQGLYKCSVNTALLNMYAFILPILKSIAHVQPNNVKLLALQK